MKENDILEYLKNSKDEFYIKSKKKKLFSFFLPSYFIRRNSRTIMILKSYLLSYLGLLQSNDLLPIGVHLALHFYYSTYKKSLDYRLRYDRGQIFLKFLAINLLFLYHPEDSCCQLFCQSLLTNMD